jgi:putative CocE/NonD family hydrolase
VPAQEHHVNQTTKTPRERFIDTVMAAANDPRPVAELGIPTRDGIELAADVYFPDASQQPAPAVLTMTPYDKGGVFVREEARFYQENGYVYVAVDCRGRGKSEGEWRAFVHDGPDGHDAVEWIARQPWCTGKVGTTGLSYMGWFQWATAAEKPEHLTAMISTSAAGRWQREIPYTDGAFQLYFGWWVFMVRRRITEFYGLGRYDWESVLRTLPLEKIGDLIDPAGQTWRDLMDHDTYDDHWKAIRYDDRYKELPYPCLHVTGWFDLEDLLGAFHHYEHMAAESPAKANQLLIAGPWSHVNCRNPHHSYADIFLGEAAALDMDAIHLRWFDHWLKGIDTGQLAEPRVKLWRGGANEWVESDHWPLAEREESLYLSFGGGEGRLRAEPPAVAGEPRSYRYDPNDPAPTRLNIALYPIEDVPIVMDEVEARPDVLVYTGEPLTEELEISGWAHLDLFASSDCDDTEWHVKLTDVHPDGRSIKVCQGCRRASYRDSLEHPTPLTPGEVHRFDVELWPVDHVFLPGHRIRVTITSSDFPWFGRNLNRFGPLKDQAEPRIATNAVHHGGAHASRIRLPIRHGRLPRQ